jgi:phospholipid/cholesterol/gamma-HCH transport system permease protein
MSDAAPAAQAEAQVEGEVLVVRLSGDWKMTAARPQWDELVARATGDSSSVRPTLIRLEDAGIGAWDSSLALIAHEAQITAASIGAKFDGSQMPMGVARIVGVLAQKTPLPGVRHSGIPNLFTVVGTVTTHLWREVKDIARLVGECAFSIARFSRGHAQFRWRDCLTEMQHCGAMALPIVGLISFLVGVILAYQGAVQLRAFGADIYVADMVGVAVVREMGPLMRSSSPAAPGPRLRRRSETCGRTRRSTRSRRSAFRPSISS